jgi:carboxyl-terminal processing protease
MDRSMVPADPGPVTPGSSPGLEDQTQGGQEEGTPGHVAGSAADGAPTEPRRIPFLAISVALVAIMAGSALFLSGYSMGRQAAAAPGTPPSESEAFEPFWDTYHAIRDRYAGGEVDRSLVVQGAIRGMIGALGDPYSAYLTSDEYRQSLLGISGQFEGIGAEIAGHGPDGSEGCSPIGAGCRLVVTRPLEGSPAEKAGMRPGDIVVSVDGATVEGLTIDGARDRIRGPKGTVVTLTVQRDGATFQLTITRDIVQASEVESRVLAGGTVGYIGVSGFSDAAADQVVKALTGHLEAGRAELILDVRGNPGGYVTAARKIASQFIASGPVFWEQDAKGNQVPTEALGDGVATDTHVRLVVLIDGGSASASEIVAGALQDTGRAQLVGQQSFGKGTVQQWQELGGAGGAFKLTIARWLTPAKRWINGVGLTPDVVVTLPDPLPAGSDPTLDRAVQILAGPAAMAALPAAA